MLRALRTGLIAMVISAGASATSITSTASTAGAAQPCVPAPNLVLVQLAQLGGSNPALLADVQAVEQADATQGDKSSGQVIQDILVAANRNGYQWDCARSRLLSPNLASQPPAGHSNAAAPAAAAAAKPGSVAAGGATVAGGSGAPSEASGSATSVSAQAAPASSRGTSRIPIPVIVVGLILCSAALFAAVRRVSRH